MATVSVSRLPLSGSTDGRPLLVGTSSVALHTAVSGSADVDEVWLWAASTDLDPGAASAIRVKFGGAASSDFIDVVIWGGGNKLLIPGAVLRNSLVIQAQRLLGPADFVVYGYVNRLVSE
jgi:hypothetical protein